MKSIRQPSATIRMLAVIEIHPLSHPQRYSHSPGGPLPDFGRRRACPRLRGVLRWDSPAFLLLHWSQGHAARFAILPMAWIEMYWKMRHTRTSSILLAIGRHKSACAAVLEGVLILVYRVGYIYKLGLPISVKAIRILRGMIPHA